jgi:glucose/arabinose dehydrogenase
MKRPTSITLALCAALVALLALAPAAGAVKARKIGNFKFPVAVTAAPGYKKLVFVTEQPGAVRVVRKGRTLKRPFLNIRSLVGYDGEERGLLSVAFPPDYKQSGLFYVDYTDQQGDINVVEFKRRSATRAKAGSARTVLQIAHRENSNHNGGQLQFLGNLLYISTGDGGNGGDPPNNAQNTDSLLGKILRIDPRPSGGAAYGIPDDNPFVGKPGRDEIFSYGLRNPYRFTFNTQGAGAPYIAIGDAGQDRFEEVEYETIAQARGANFGWDALEGFGPYQGANNGTPDPGGTTKPAHVYGTHDDGNCTIIGGLVAHDRKLKRLSGRYIYSDFCAGDLHSFIPSPGGSKKDHKIGLHIDSPTSFGTDNQNRVYVTSLDGPLYRLVNGHH